MDGEAEDNKATLIKQLKEAVQPHIPPDTSIAEWIDDECCERFLQARDWDLQQATKMLVNTIAWRHEKKPDTTPCPQCPEDPFAHNLRIVGIDLEKRPVMYTCFGQATGRFNVEGNITHLCKTLEDASVLMKKLGVQKWVWIVDFEGFGVYDCSLPLLNQTVHLLDHYPSRLGQLVCLDSPWLFSGLWKTVSPLLPPVTKSKISFTSLKEIDTKLRPFLGDELADWIHKETKENRDPARSKGKKYWEWLNEDGSAKDHDARGSRSFVNGPHYVLPVKEEHCKSLQLAQKDT